MSTKIVFEGIAEAKHEDSGCALIYEVDSLDKASDMFVRLQSWDKTGQHLEAMTLKGKKVRVTVEVVEEPKFEIPAECHSDDRKVEVKFNASLWLEQASDDAILDLMGCGCGGDYPADEVAIWMAGHDENVVKMFSYIEVNEPMGFECNVEPRPLLKWIKENKPNLFAKVVEDEDIMCAIGEFPDDWT
jgi:hypothetical protein